MRIGIDIDGVLSELEKYEDYYFTKFLVENGIDYHIGEAKYGLYRTYNVTKEVEDKFWNEYYDDYCQNVEVRTFASEVIKRLRAEGDEIIIITARWSASEDNAYGKTMRDYIYRWLKKNDIIYDKILFVKDSKGQKLAEIKDYKVDIMIEDSPANIKEISKLIPVICFDCRYNHKLKVENMQRCYSWYDIYKVIHQQNTQK